MRLVKENHSMLQFPKICKILTSFSLENKSNFYQVFREFQEEKIKILQKKSLIEDSLKLISLILKRYLKMGWRIHGACII